MIIIGLPWLYFHLQDYLDSPTNTLNVSTCSNKISRTSFGLKVKERRSAQPLSHLSRTLTLIFLICEVGLKHLPCLASQQVAWWWRGRWWLASIGWLFCTNSIFLCTFTHHSHHYPVSRTFVIPHLTEEETEAQRDFLTQVTELVKGKAKDLILCGLDLKAHAKMLWQGWRKCIQMLEL